MNTRLRARLVSFDHSKPGQQKTVIAGIVEGSLGHASHGEIIDCEIESRVVRRMRSLVPLGDIMAAVANLGETPEMIERGDMVIIEGREATRRARDKCVCGERQPASCVCEFMSDALYEERSGQ
jgi:hypothetical protein